MAKSKWYLVKGPYMISVTTLGIYQTESTRHSEISLWH